MINWSELTRIILDLDAAMKERDPEAFKLQMRSIWLFARFTEDF